MPISIIRTTLPPSVQWVAPTGTRYVVCGMFSSPPTIEDGEFDSLDNVVAMSVLIPNTSFPLETDCKKWKAGCSGTLVDRLLVGCWAYDRTELTRASDLVELTPRDIVDRDGLIAADCATETANTACYRPSSREFGVCHEGCCRRRCTVDSDCSEFTTASPSGAAGAAAAPDDGGMPACTHDCAWFDGTIGACVPLADTEERCGE